jgi:hypothetical protein
MSDEELVFLNTLLEGCLPEIEKVRAATIADRSLTLNEFLDVVATDVVVTAEELIRKVQTEMGRRGIGGAIYNG